MSNIATALNTFAEQADLLNLEGKAQTSIPGVHFFRDSKGSARQPLVYQSGIIIVAQGRKVIHFPEHQIQYGAGNYLVIGIPMPLECEAFAEDGLPIMGLAVDVDPALLHQLVNQMHQHQGYINTEHCRQVSCVQSAKIDDPLMQTIKRLIEVLPNTIESDIFGADIVKELVYRVLCGPQGKTLIGLAQHDGHYARIARSLNTLHANYASPISVETLAEDVNMSVSAFHRAFRQVTFESPLQYLKKIRLVKAKDLISANGTRANEAAFQVGYSSASQFSREFKRHFNQSPSDISLNA
ncbi:AraC family transcriptional regulator [Paraglaciecola sp. 20A4]|uniref:AraC family transcriptional regulator n=1 Tax=Paraglaciecola sp. 20A4 TaxID=2687288 RepID=UPI0014096F71|nr:AraC family transcriptional regulator [Paraglaciecola sp. 20A4]